MANYEIGRREFLMTTAGAVVLSGASGFSRIVARQMLLSKNDLESARVAGEALEQTALRISGRAFDANRRIDGKLRRPRCEVERARDQIAGLLATIVRLRR
jgi:hypothetical protein